MRHDQHNARWCPVDLTKALTGSSAKPSLSRSKPWQVLYNRLKVLRKERGWSQAQLAERLQISRQAVNAIETGSTIHRCVARSGSHAFSVDRLPKSSAIGQVFGDGT